MSAQSGMGRLEQANALRRSALERLRSGDYVKAKEEFKRALAASPQLISRITLDYEKAMENDGENIGLRLSLADLYLRIGEVDLAILELEEVIDIAPKMPQVYNILGQLLIGRGAISESIRLLERALAEGLADVSLTEMLAGAYLESGNINSSIWLYEEILKRNGDSKKTLRVLGDLYLRRSDKMKSASMYLRLFKIDPETYKEVSRQLEGILERSDEGSDIAEMLADVYLKGGDPDKAVNEYKKIYGDDKFKVAESAAKFKQALEHYPGHPGLICAYAEALILKGAYTESAIEYSKLIKMGPSYVSLAIEGYQNIIRKYPDNLLAHQFLGDALNVLGKYEEAINEFRKALSLNEGESDIIIKKCRDILKVRPDISSLHQLLGEIYLVKKDFKRAMLEGEEALALDTHSVDAYILLGDGYKGLGMFTKSADSYRMGLNLDPFNIVLHSRLKEGRRLELHDSVKALKLRIKDDQWRKSLHLDLAKLFLELKSWDDATLELQEALKDQARAPFVFNLMGVALKERGRFELAASQFIKALEVLPEELSDMDKAIRFNLASTYEALGKVDEAISAYQVIRDKDADFGGVEDKLKVLASLNPASLRNKMFALVLGELDDKGLLQVWGRDIRQLSHGRRGEDMGLSFAQTHNDKAFDYLVRGLFKSAEEELVLATSLDARLPSALNNLAVIYAHNGRFDDAATRLSAAADVDPKSAVIHNNLGVINHLKGDMKSAEIEFLRASSLDPDLSPVSVNLGDSYYSQGNARQAIACWEKVKSFSPVAELAARRLRYKTADPQ